MHEQVLVMHRPHPKIQKRQNSCARDGAAAAAGPSQVEAEREIP
jgi:hypothetical protein